MRLNPETYWNNKGRYQEFGDRLRELIPAEGSVDKPRSTNRKLEKFRKACNCYYDLYNNGLCNRTQEFREVFGFASTHHKIVRGRAARFLPSMYNRTEDVMDEIVLAAAEEQGYVTLEEEIA